jgi:predicted NAD/FAD-binding protein
VKSVAVVGAGVSGLTAAYVLRNTHDVTLYESASRLGGHADTHDIVDPAGRNLALDTGFLVHNERTYPTLLRMFAELGVTTQETEMSMSVSCGGCGLEYAGGKGLSGLFAQPAKAADPRHLRMLADVPRFHRGARELLASAPSEVEPTLAEFLAAGRWSPRFVSHVVTPLVSAVWSCPPAVAGRYPARYLFAFLDNHGMLSVQGSPQWRTVVGGSRTYVERAAKGLSAVLTSTPVRAIRRAGEAGVEIRDETDSVATYDAVVIATHPDQALALLLDPTRAESETLGAFSYTSNPTLLHTDTSVLPHARRARASWNYRLDTCDASPDAVVVSYDITRLQRLDTDTTYVVSLNAADRVDPTTVVDRMDYAHPAYTPESVAAQSDLPALNGGVTAFAGAWHGWGFHEDGARSGLAAAVSLGGAW